MAVWLFDLDGTLVDRLPSLEAFLPKQYKKYSAGKPLAESYTQRFLELERNGHTAKHEVYQTLIDEFRLNASEKELITDFRQNAFKVRKTQPGAQRVLGQLQRQGHRLGVVTNGSAQAQTQKLRASGLDALVEFSLISEELGTRKPEPEIFLAAAQRFDVAASRCIFVGDHPEKDIVGARGVGMRTVWLRHGRPWLTHLEPPTFVVSELQNLLALRV